MITIVNEAAGLDWTDCKSRMSTCSMEFYGVFDDENKPVKCAEYAVTAAIDDAVAIATAAKEVFDEICRNYDGGISRISTVTGHNAYTETKNHYTLCAAVAAALTVASGSS